MTITQKIQLLSILPLMVAMLAVGFATHYQFEQLSDDIGKTYKTSVIDSRKKELQNYTSLALSSINHLYRNDDVDEPIAQELVNAILTNLQYGADGYFFAYDTAGNGIVHPKQPFRVGRNWWDLKDSSGQFLIQDLVTNAKTGGGFVEYTWEKPSSSEVATKLAYSVMLDDWQWMVGTGLYIDDIDQQVSLIKTDFDSKINNSSFVIIIIAILAFVVVFVCGLFLQFSERRLADGRLQELTRRIMSTQEEERNRVSRELHDGISQLLASAKFSIETAALKIANNEDPDPYIKQSQTKLSQTLADLRRISRDLHPRVLDDHGLSVGIESLADSFEKRTGISIDFQHISVRNLLPMDMKTTLYRVAQETLTNVERHSQATHVNITINLQGQWLVLSISDNGRGFDVESIERDRSPTVGIGLRNMQERLSYHKGRFTVKSSKKGTRIEARIPKSQLSFSGKREQSL